VFAGRYYALIFIEIGEGVVMFQDIDRGVPFILRADRCHRTGEFWFTARVRACVDV